MRRHQIVAGTRAIDAGRPMAFNKLLQISAFYRNDQPNGVGVTITQEYGNLD